VRIGRKEKIALIPLVLCVLIWIVPDPTTPHVSSSSRVELPEEITGTSLAFSEASWQPGIELPLLGLIASIAIFCLMRIQDRLQERARQLW
jgi:hypothetical protein